MTIDSWINEALAKLKSAEVDAPRSDVFAMLENVTGKEKAWLIAHSDELLSKDMVEKLNSFVKRRVKREPLAYILGEKEFYGRNFIITPDVLIPRPESEDFINLLKEIRPKIIVEIGTGSGCLAVSAKLELPDCQVTAIDISEDALKIAQKNASKYRAEISFLHGSLLEPIKKFNSEVIVANLPYVPENLATSPEIKTEPSLALFAGKDGLEVYKKFWKEAKNLAAKPDYILVESLKSQHSKMANFGESTGYGLQKTQGLVQIFKR